MTNFFIAGTLVYMGTIVLEGVSMSLTSKVCPQLALSLLSAVPRQQTQMLQHQSMILASSSLLDVCRQRRSCSWSMHQWIFNLKAGLYKVLLACCVHGEIRGIVCMPMKLAPNTIEPLAGCLFGAEEYFCTAGY